MDNILGNINADGLTIEDFSKIVSEFEESGDILEFGTCAGDTTIDIARLNTSRNVFTIDHFKGLELTKKPVWNGAGWIEGAFRVGDPNSPWIPKTKEEIFTKLSQYSNIKMIECDIHELTAPENYGITNTLVACHIDVDIYEPAVSSLNFLDKCIWPAIFIRFDDWHGHEPLFDHHERLAFKEWIDRTGYTYEVTHGGMWGGVMVSRI